MPATVEIHCSNVRPGFAFRAIDHKINWTTCKPWGRRGVHHEGRGTKMWEQHRVWSERAPEGRWS